MAGNKYFDQLELERATTEEVFDRTSVELLNAVTEEVLRVAGILPIEGGEARSWNRDEAICVGLLVRCSKLLRAYVGHFRDHQFEVCNYLMRGILESLVNVFFLIANGTPEMLQRFRALSFRHDKQVLELIEKNVDERKGLVLPIEERISAAVSRRLEQAGVDLDEVPQGGRERWGGSDKEKLEALGIADLYQPLFVGPSAYIHGTWHELVVYHLRDMGDGDFAPAVDFSGVRPHYPLALSRLTAEVVIEYIADRLAEDQAASETAVKLEEMLDAAMEMEQLHENFLGRTGGPELAF